MKRVLLVSAHPDDMEIGMGGTVAKMAASGDTIISVVITDGRRAPDPNSIGPEKMAAVRRVESERAGALLGVRETKFFDLESVASEKAIIEATRKMCEVIGEFEPDEVYTLHPELDRHASHRREDLCRGVKRDFRSQHQTVGVRSLGIVCQMGPARRHHRSYW